MQRHITEELIRWKTYIIREFGKEYYEHFIEINFVENQNAEKIFEKTAAADEIITN